MLWMQGVIIITRIVALAIMASVDGLWPSEWLPGKREEARKKIANMLEHSIGNS